MKIEDLPILDDIADKVEKNELLTELELYIFTQQPKDEIACYKWRADLTDLVRDLTKEKK